MKARMPGYLQWRKHLTLIKNNPDISLILLDIMLPDVDGLEICRQIRNTVSCPILFVTAKNRTYDTMLGLEMGADDYIAKPFVTEELVARVRAHLRREQRSLHQKSASLAIGNIQVNPESYEVKVDNKSVELTMREFQLLHYLFAMPERWFQRNRFSTPCGHRVCRHRHRGRQHQKPSREA